MPPRLPLLRAAAFSAVLVSGASGCDDLSEFRGTFAGQIVEGGFVRSCFAANTTAQLQFDPDHAVAPLPEGLAAADLNRLTTSDGTFHDTVLEPISALPHDPLSKLDFPGSRRLRNFMLLARPESGPLRGRDAVVVVSLLADERVEVRVIGRTDGTIEQCAADQDVEAGVAADGGPASVAPGDGGPAAEPVDGGVRDAGVLPAGGAPPQAGRPREYFGLFRLKVR